MYAICKEVHPPTGVEHSLYCNFFNNIERNLVVVSTNLIRVYNIIQQLEVHRHNIVKVILFPSIFELLLTYILISLSSNI